MRYRIDVDTTLFRRHVPAGTKSVILVLFLKILHTEGQIVKNIILVWMTV